MTNLEKIVKKVVERISQTDVWAWTLSIDDGNAEREDLIEWAENTNEYWYKYIYDILMESDWVETDSDLIYVEKYVRFLSKDRIMEIIRDSEEINDNINELRTYAQETLAKTKIR